MKNRSLFMQIVMVVIAGAIAWMYIKPTIAEIRLTQDEIVKYRAELDKVTATNQLLATKLNTVNAVPINQVDALQRFLPEDIDTVAIYKDLVAIADQSQVSITAIAGGDLGTGEEDGRQTVSDEEVVGETAAITNTKSHSFTLTVNGTYDDIKVFLDALNVSNYPLYVDAVTFTSDEEVGLSAEMTLTTYTLDVKALETVSAGAGSAEAMTDDTMMVQ